MRWRGLASILLFVIPFVAYAAGTDELPGDPSGGVLSFIFKQGVPLGMLAFVIWYLLTKAMPAQQETFKEAIHAVVEGHKETTSRVEKNKRLRQTLRGMTRGELRRAEHDEDEEADAESASAARRPT